MVKKKNFAGHFSVNYFREYRKRSGSLPKGLLYFRYSSLTSRSGPNFRKRSSWVQKTKGKYDCTTPGHQKRIFFFLQPMLSLTRMNSLANDSSRFSMGDLVNGFSS